MISLRGAVRRGRLTRLDAPCRPTKFFPNPDHAFRDLGAFSVRGARVGLCGFEPLDDPYANHALLLGCSAGLFGRLRSGCIGTSQGEDCVRICGCSSSDSAADGDHSPNRRTHLPPSQRGRLISCMASAGDSATNEKFSIFHLHGSVEPPCVNMRTNGNPRLSAFRLARSPRSLR
jgi:hypothetical protein